MSTATDGSALTFPQVIDHLAGTPLDSFGDVVWRQDEHPDYALLFAGRSGDAGSSLHQYLSAGKPVYEAAWVPYRVVRRTGAQVHLLPPDGGGHSDETIKIDREVFDSRGAVGCTGRAGPSGRWVSTARLLWEQAVVKNRGAAG